MKKILTLVIMAFAVLTSMAQHVSEAEARQRAEAFLQSRGKALTELSRLQTAGSRQTEASRTDAPGYYVFNIGSADGFVIVSGSERTASILGYADSGTLDADRLPDGLSFLLACYAEETERAEETAATVLDSEASVAAREAQKSPKQAARSGIAPLIQTRWSQESPYNNYCPSINDVKTVTGCVATSMAQVMYYHQYPTAACTAIPGYSTSTLDADRKSYTLNVDALPATTFSWNDMTTTYADGSTGAAADAVALLMQYCGSALQMVYGLAVNGGSSAFNESIAYALTQYFGYDGSIRHVARRHYSYQDWIDLVYGELASGRPVVLGGQSAGGGHSFICDGYNTDDYFHINWGWGGSSDGYFRLSALNPYEQGAGGSSTLDGFSFSQDAVIGIQPNNGKAAQPMVQLEKITLDGSTGEIAFALCNYQFGTNAFDYAVQMVDGSGTVVKTLYEADNQSMPFNKDVNFTTTIDPEGVADGTYYIKVVIRNTGASSWADCFDGPAQQLTAVISGGNVTSLTGIINSERPTLNSIAISDSPTVGYEAEVTATVTGGATDYHENLQLRVNGTTVQGKQADIPAGKTVDVRFAYTPSTAGDNTLAILAGGTQIGSQIVNVAASDAANTQDITVEPVIANLDGGKLYGNALRVTAHVTNPSDVNSYASRLNCSLRIYNNATDDVGAYVDAIVQHKNITIAKSSSTDVTFEYTGLEPGRFYCLRFSYTQSYDDNGTLKTRTQEALISDRYEMGEGYLLYNVDGTMTICKPSSTITAESADFADLRGLSDLGGVTVAPSTNPNCLYLLADGATTPTGLDGKNVVKGTTAESITLTDGNAFYSPIDFTATTVSYSRTFSVAAAGTSGWNTIMLPFTVSAINCNVIGTVDWFHSAGDTGKNFWLREFTADGDGSVTFDYANTFTANTPYIIAVPDDRWGTEWQMTGRSVTFSGTNVPISATATAAVNGNHYKFCGTTIGTAASDIYVLNAKGSKFVKKTTDTAIEPFRAWFETVSISSLTLPSLAIVSPETTGITTTECTDSTDKTGVWYDMQGRKLDKQPMRKGLYIQGNKKVLVK